MNEAPARISMIMQVSRVAPMTLVQKLSQVSAPDHHAMSSEPSTPQAAHSVAVAQPISSTTNTSSDEQHAGDEAEGFLELLPQRRLGLRRRHLVAG